jgi:predicted nucleic acid-binding protein
MRPLILDTGALLAAHKRSSRLWSLLDEAARAGAEVLVPAASVAECIRGGFRDAVINRLLNGRATRVTIHDEDRARVAGKLLARTGTNNTIDAFVVAEAVRQGGAIIATSDPDDIADLSAGHRQIRAIRV